MPAEAFLDTNIFVYHIDVTDPRKQGIAESLVWEMIEDETGAISHRVVHEFCNVALRHATAKLTPQEVERFVADVFGALEIMPASLELSLAAVSVPARYGVHFYDALMIAAALEAGCTTIYSEDMQHGQRFGELVIRNPFL